MTYTKLVNATLPPALLGMVSVDEEILGGELCFTGTRVPVLVVVDTLAEGAEIDEVLRSYPSLRIEHVRAVLDWQADLARESIKRFQEAS